MSRGVVLTTGRRTPFASQMRSGLQKAGALNPQRRLQRASARGKRKRVETTHPVRDEPVPPVVLPAAPPGSARWAVADSARALAAATARIAAAGCGSEGREAMARNARAAPRVQDAAIGMAERADWRSGDVDRRASQTAPFRHHGARGSAWGVEPWRRVAFVARHAGLHRRPAGAFAVQWPALLSPVAADAPRSRRRRPCRRWRRRCALPRRRKCGCVSSSRPPSPKLGLPTRHGLTRRAAQIRFTRMGRIKSPFYRLVVMDSRTRRDGRPLEVRASPF